jgi:hypothetical protein
VWLDGSLHAIDPDAQITYDEQAPDRPWQIRTSDGALDLEFTPIGVHRESLNLGLVRSRFLQPVGEFRGTVSAGGESVEVVDLPGVVENQDVLW